MIYTEPGEYKINIKATDRFGNSTSVSRNVTVLLPKEAYAVFDSSNGVLSFFKDDEGKYSQGQVIDTKTYFTGVENTQGGTSVPWYMLEDSVSQIEFLDPIKPASTANWFSTFSSCTKINHLELLDTSNVTDMFGMFSLCNGFTTLDLSHFNTSNVTSMAGMFFNCINLQQVDVHNFDTSNVTDMDSMFSDCNNLKQLDLSTFDVSGCVSRSAIDQMFLRCMNLRNIYVCNDWRDVCEAEGERMFGACYKLRNYSSQQEHISKAHTGEDGCLTSDKYIGYLQPVSPEDIEELIKHDADLPYVDIPLRVTLTELDEIEVTYNGVDVPHTDIQVPTWEIKNNNTVRLYFHSSREPYSLEDGDIITVKRKEVE